MSEVVTRNENVSFWFHEVRGEKGDIKLCEL